MSSTPKQRLFAFFSLTTPAVWVLLALAICSGAIVLPRGSAEHGGMTLWLFAKSHEEVYQAVTRRWNEEQSTPGTKMKVVVIDQVALERRVLSGFMSGTPVAELVETERSMGAKTFTGPLEDIGFVDITDRLREEGMINELNGPSFAPWTSRGRIFGIPHDVHPVLLAYRSDIVEAAGIDLSKVETWQEFFEAVRPLMKDEDGDGRPERYALNFWANQNQPIEVLLLQAGGTIFDENEHINLNSERNAFVLATLATWCGGPGRVVEVQDKFSVVEVQKAAIRKFAEIDLSPIGRTTVPTDVPVVPMIVMALAATALAVLAGALYRRRDAA